MNRNWAQLTRHLKPIRKYWLDVVVGIVLVLTILGGYQIAWIRHRHAFLRDQDVLDTLFMKAVQDRDYSCPKVDILDRVTASSGLCWLFGEDDVVSLDVLVVVDDRSLDLARALDSYEEVIEARGLFPEAQIVAAIMPRSDVQPLKP